MLTVVISGWLAYEWFYVSFLSFLGFSPERLGWGHAASDNQEKSIYATSSRRPQGKAQSHQCACQGPSLHVHPLPSSPPLPPTGGPVTPEQASCWLLSPDLQKCDRPSLPSSNVPSQIESVAPSFRPGDDWLLWTGCPISVALVLGIAEFPGVAQALTQDEGWGCVAQWPPPPATDRLLEVLTELLLAAGLTSLVSPFCLFELLGCDLGVLPALAAGCFPPGRPSAWRHLQATASSKPVPAGTSPRGPAWEERALPGRLVCRRERRGRRGPSLASVGASGAGRWGDTCPRDFHTPSPPTPLPEEKDSLLISPKESSWKVRRWGRRRG